MSWNIKAIGKRENVKAIVWAEPNLPPQLKDGIIAIIDADESNPTARSQSTYPDGVRVETYGHYAPGSCSNIAKLEVEHIKLAPDPS